MKKIITRLVLVIIVAIGFGAGTSALARTTNSSGVTTTGVTFTGSPTKVTRGGGGDTGVPNGPVKPKPANGGSGAMITPGRHSRAKTLKATAADIVAGKLPQTSDAQMMLVSLVGFFLLIVLLLLALIYRQARKLQEGSESR